MILTKRRNCYLLAFFVFYTIGIFGQQNADATVPTIQVNDKLEKKDLKLSDICSDIAYTKLEFNDNYPISGKDRLYDVHVTDEYIFFQNTSEFLRYTRDGKKVERIGSIGQGPGDYLAGSSFVVDETSSKLFIRAIGTKNILIYDYVSNKYIYKFSLPFDETTAIKAANDGIILMVGSKDRRYTSTVRYFSLKFLNNEGKILVEKTNPNFIKPKTEYLWNLSIMGGATCFWKDEATSFGSIYEIGSDTIHRITLDLKILPRFFIICPMRDYDENTSVFHAETSKYLFWILDERKIKASYMGFYDKTLQKSFIYTRYYWDDITDENRLKIRGVKNDIDGGLPVMIPYSSRSPSKWHVFVDAYELIDYVNSPEFKNAEAKGS